MGNQVSSPPVTIQQKSNSTEASTSANSNLTTSKSKENEKEKSAKEVHKPILPFPNKLKGNKAKCTDGKNL